jgi:predicted HTH domain antitoxin
MLSVRVWNLLSDGDAKAVRFLENEFLRFRQLGDLTIRKTGRSALRKCRIKSEISTTKLSKAIQHYLNQDDYIIFVVNSNNPSSDYEKQLELKSLVSQIRRVVKVWDFSDKVAFTPEIQEPQSLVNTQWKGIVSEFLAEVENDRKKFQERWDKTMERFDDVFANTSVDRLTNDLDAAIKRYQESEVTLGRAAELAGIHRFEFEEALAARGIWKIVEVDSAEALKEGVSLIKSLHKSNVSTEEK